jgi:aryl-alcohol dehydrogenase-like predicted oxidoreductase
MRLSTEDARDDSRAEGVLLAALEAGVELLDTADSYARDDTDVGHNERLIGTVLPRLTRRRPQVATKGGLIRPDGGFALRAGAPYIDVADGFPEPRP